MTSSDNKSHATEVTSPIEVSLRIIALGQEQPEKQATADFCQAWEETTQWLRSRAIKKFRAWQAPNPVLSAEDVVNDVLIVMLTGGFQSCDKTLPIVPYVSFVLACRCVNYYRTHRRKRMTFLDSWDSVGRPTRTPSEAEELVRQALHRLPPRYRDALTSQYVEGLSAAEAAHKYGMRPKNIDVLRCRARKMLGLLIEASAPWLRVRKDREDSSEPAASGENFIGERKVLARCR